MPEATITSKGQVTIPKKIREKLNLRPGDKVNFVETNEGEIKIHPQKKSIKDLRGILHRPGQKAKSVEDMNEGIREYLKEKYQK